MHASGLGPETDLTRSSIRHVECRAKLELNHSRGPPREKLRYSSKLKLYAVTAMHVYLARYPGMPMPDIGFLEQHNKPQQITWASENGNSAEVAAGHCDLYTITALVEVRVICSLAPPALHASPGAPGFHVPHPKPSPSGLIVSINYAHTQFANLNVAALSDL
eukprot:745817-Rhodomonas_salina.3